MRTLISVVALVGLSACTGGGSSSGADVDLTPDAPDVAMNTQFGTLLNGMRTGANLTYDSDIGRAAQEHANDMIDRNYFSVTIPGTTGNNNGMEDIGDRVTRAGYTWSDIVQLIEQGDFTLDEALAEFDNAGNCGGAGQDLCFTSEDLTDFGIAKAGAGSGQKWVLVLAGQGN